MTKITFSNYIPTLAHSTYNIFSKITSSTYKTLLNIDATIEKFQPKILISTYGIFPEVDLIINKFHPKFTELKYTIYTKAVVETIFARPMEYLVESLNPTVTSVIRDFIMWPGVIRNYVNAQEISSTKIIYDEYSVIGTIGRTVCKAGVFGLADYVSNSTDPKVKYSEAARVGNGFCEVPSVFINIAVSKAKQASDRLQKTNYLADNAITIVAGEEVSFPKDIFKPWYSFPFTDFKSEWISQSVLGAVGRFIAYDQFGKAFEVVKKLDIIAKPYAYADNLKNQAIATAFNITPLNSTDKIWTQIDKVNDEIFNDSQENNGFEIYMAYAKAFAVNSIILGAGWFYRVEAEWVQAAVIITVTRIGYNLVEQDLLAGYPLYTAAKIAAVDALAYGVVPQAYQYFYNAPMPEQEGANILGVTEDPQAEL